MVAGDKLSFGRVSYSLGSDLQNIPEPGLQSHLYPGRGWGGPTTQLLALSPAPLNPPEWLLGFTPELGAEVPLQTSTCSPQKHPPLRHGTHPCQSLLLLHLLVSARGVCWLFMCL